MVQHLEKNPWNKKGANNGTIAGTNVAQKYVTKLGANASVKHGTNASQKIKPKTQCKIYGSN